MLRADVVVGGLLGDEGKGKYVGGRCHGYDAVMRVNASTNAGHCVSDGTNSYVTRQLPSVFFPNKTLLIIAPGALLNPVALAEEVRGRPDIAELAGKLKIASSVSLVIRPYLEKGQGGMSNVIGSTHQGTGPSAVARAARHSLHLYDLRAVADGDEAAAEEVLNKLARTCVETLPLRFSSGSDELHRYCVEVLDELVASFEDVRSLVGDPCVDFNSFVLDELHQGHKRILVEGCNGLLLDNLHGAHPHVTSTSTNSGALICGANLSPKSIDQIIVVIAAYSTCLGKRPFPTEMAETDAAHFFANCNEIDVAQHNRRRIGWIDLPALRKALSGSQGAVLHLNKLDVLSGLERIKICDSYQIDGRSCQVLPDDPWLYRRAEPHYLEVDGWAQPLAEARSPADLPANARSYVELVADLLPNDIVSLGVGPRNADFIELDR